MIASYLSKAREAILALTGDPTYPPLLEKMTTALCAAFSAGNKVLFAGNGGSAADCQHLAGELVVRFRADRPALPAIALTVDTSVLTACLNDYGPDPVFSRQVEALGRSGDILWAFSTSGNSRNILLACEAARKNGLTIFGFTGRDGGALPAHCDLCFRAPTDLTSHIQECHIIAGHLLCLEVERRLFAGSAL